MKRTIARQRVLRPAITASAEIRAWRAAAGARLARAPAGDVSFPEQTITDGHRGDSGTLGSPRSPTTFGSMSERLDRGNHYRILHVQPDAPAAVLKSSYRALMLTLDMHPDRGGDSWNAALINEAYAVLSDPARRAEYDRTLEPTSRDAGPVGGEGTLSSPVGQGSADDRMRSGTERWGCLFCGSPPAISAALRAAESCPRCRSPRALAGEAQLEASGRRAARRVATDGRVDLYLNWPQAVPDHGRIVDLSPRGLQFEASSPIGVFRIIKLAGPLVDAVARVATCRDLDGRFGIGVEFYTVRFHPARGTFISIRA